MEKENKKKLLQVISFVVVFSISLFIFSNWHTIEKFVFQLFK